MSSQKSFVLSTILLGVVIAAIVLTFWFPVNFDATSCNLPEGCPASFEFIKLYKYSQMRNLHGFTMHPHYITLTMIVAISFVVSYLITFIIRAFKPSNQTSQ
jgi:hypothetical protein